MFYYRVMLLNVIIMLLKLQSVSILYVGRISHFQPCRDFLRLCYNVLRCNGLSFISSRISATRKVQNILLL